MQRSRVGPTVAALLCLVQLVGCDAIWDFGNRGKLAQDVLKLWARTGVPAPAFDCHMVGTTRTGTCAARMPTAQAALFAGVVNGPPLAPGQASDAAYQNWARQGPCAGQTKWTHIFKAAPNGRELRTDDGTAFEYLLLFHDEQSAATCIQLAYAYG